MNTQKGRTAILGRNVCWCLYPAVSVSGDVWVRGLLFMSFFQGVSAVMAGAPESRVFEAGESTS